MNFAFLYSSFLRRYRLLVWLVLGIGVGLLAVGLKDFHIDASSDQLLLDKDPDLKLFRDVSADFPGQDFVFVLFAPEDELFSKINIDRLQVLVADLSKVEGVDSAFSLLEAPLLEGLSISDISSGEFSTLLTPGVDLHKAKQELSNSPLFGELLVSRDGRVTGVLANLTQSQEQGALLQRRYALWASDTDAARLELGEVQQRLKALQQQRMAHNQKLIQDIRAVVEKHSSEHVNLFLGGPAMIVVDVLNFATSDVVVFGVLALLFFAIVLSLLFRHVVWVAIPLGISTIVVLGLSGLFGWVGWLPSVVSANFIALLLVLSISLCMHLIVNFQEQCKKNPEAGQVERVSNTLRMMFWPCLFTALTTMVGFGSLVISGIEPVVNFGLMMVSGIGTAFVFAFTLMPLCLMSIPAERVAYVPRSGQFNQYLASMAGNHPRKIIAVALVLFVVACAGIPTLSVDNRFIDYFKSDTDIYRGMNAIDRHLGGTLPMEIIFDAPPRGQMAVVDEVEDDFGDFDDFGDDMDGEASEPEDYWFNSNTLIFLERLHGFLEKNPSVGVVRSLHSGMAVAGQLYGRKLNEFEIQALRALLPENIGSLLIEDYLSRNGQRMRVSLRLVEGDRAQNRTQLFEDIRDYLQQQGELQGSEVRLSGLALLYNNMLNSLYDSQIRTIALVFLVIGAMFALLFRSLLVAFMGLVPNVLAAALVLGSMGWLRVPLDLMTITVVSISVGIAVDNCIHYCYRYRHERERGANPADAMRNSHSSIGRAVYYTTLSVAGGFLLMTTSNFLPTIYFGSFNVLAIVSALLGALTLLPVMLVMSRWSGSKTPAS